MSAGNDLVMPKLGLTMTEGLLAEWLVKPGDKVRAGQILFVVETDKLSTEIEATGEGEIVELVADAGTTLPVGAVVARWTGEGSPGTEAVEVEEAPPPAPQVAPAAPSPPPASRTERSDRIVASPLAKRIAKREGIDLSGLAGTGGNGRIKARDVEAVLATAAVADVPVAESAPVSAPAVRLAQEAHPFHLATEADVGALEKLRARLNEDIAPREIALLHFVLAAVARCARAIPELGSADLAVAGDTRRIIRDASRLSLSQLAAADAPSEADPGAVAVAVTDAGMLEATYFTPCLEEGQAVALGVGTVRKLFRPDSAGQPELREELGLVLVCDPRILDRAGAATLLGSVVGLLEKPLGLLGL